MAGEQSVNASPTTTIAMIEQGLKVFSGIYKRIHRSLKEEIGLIQEWNAKLLNDPDFAEDILDRYRNVIDDKIEATDFTGEDFDFEPVSDETVVTDMQRMARGQFLKEWVNDPYIEPLEIRRRILGAAGIEDIDALLRKSSNIQEQMQMMQAQMAQQQEQNRAQELQIEQHKLRQKDREISSKVQVDEATAIEKRTNALKILAKVADSKVMTGTNRHVVCRHILVIPGKVIQVSDAKVRAGALDIPDTVIAVRSASINQHPNRNPVGTPLGEQPGGVTIITRAVAQDTDPSGPTVTIKIVSPLAKTTPLGQRVVVFVRL